MFHYFQGRTATAVQIVLVGLYTGWLVSEGIQNDHQDHAAAWVVQIPAWGHHLDP